MQQQTITSGKPAHVDLIHKCNIGRMLIKACIGAISSVLGHRRNLIRIFFEQFHLGKTEALRYGVPVRVFCEYVL